MKIHLVNAMLQKHTVITFNTIIVFQSALYHQSIAVDQSDDW